MYPLRLPFPEKQQEVFGRLLVALVLTLGDLGM